jgi:hypothetical protein
MIRTVSLHLLAVLVALMAGDRTEAAQAAPPEDRSALRASIERRFEIDRLRNGIALRPRDASLGIRLIEVTEGAVAIDGQPATGAELRDKLGADADLILQVSYLGIADRQSLFATPSSDSSGSSASDRSSRSRREFRGRHRWSRDGDRVAILGGDIDVAEHDRVDGDAVAIGGSVRVDGEVRGDVVSIGGNVTLGPHASVADNVVVVGGSLQRDPGAHVGGRVQEVALGRFQFDGLRNVNPLRLWWTSMFGSAVALAGTLARLAILCLCASLVVLLARRDVERASEFASTATLKASAVGLLTQLLFLPVLVLIVGVLIVTIVGIPLLLLVPFLILGLCLVALVGFTGVAFRIGTLLGPRFGWPTDNPYVTTLVGIVAVLSPLLLARLINLGGSPMVPFGYGFGLIAVLVEYVAWTVGFGAIVLARFTQRTVQAQVAPGTA